MVVTGHSLRRVVLVRHGERPARVAPDGEGDGGFPADPGLTPRGHAQARACGMRLALDYHAGGVVGLLASPFYRTVQTAAPIAEALHCSILLEWGLAEWHNPRWYGSDRPPRLRSIAQLRAQFPQVAETYRSQVARPALETRYDTWQRARQLADWLRNVPSELGEGGTVVLVGHSISVDMVSRCLCDEQDGGNKRVVPFASISEVECGSDGVWRVRALGCTRHLSSSPV
mmetsp:Transcript_14791/g.30092  ORF Transcript_14791/g.30092 Transcript_14791/m.30092 type:complete len:229 (+) Transcript_14791:762-1448(+)